MEGAEVAEEQAAAAPETAVVAEAEEAAAFSLTLRTSIEQASLVSRHQADFEAGAGGNNFLKGVKWSPDGLCLLSNCDDNVLRLFEVSYEQAAGDEVRLPHHRTPPHTTAHRGTSRHCPPTLASQNKAVLQVCPGDTVFDYAWSPLSLPAPPPPWCFP